MRIEIAGGIGVDPDVYSDLVSELSRVLTVAGFKFEGSGFGVQGINMGATGKGPLTTQTIREIEKEIRSFKLRVGFGERDLAIFVFSK